MYGKWECIDELNELGINFEDINNVTTKQPLFWSKMANNIKRFVNDDNKRLLTKDEVLRFKKNKHRTLLAFDDNYILYRLGEGVHIHYTRGKKTYYGRII